MGNRVDLNHSHLKELIYAGKCRVGILINWLLFKIFFIYIKKMTKIHIIYRIAVCIYTHYI